MKKFPFFIAVILFFQLLPGSCSGQKSDTRNSLKIVFYNCENLFDTIDDKKNKGDNEFLPENKLGWDSERYYTKIKNISHVIYSIDSVNLPALVGLGEVENKNVLNDIVKSAYLKKADYKIVHYESSDDRGIDVALLYNPSFIKVIYSRKVNVFDEGKKLREILYAQVLAFKSDTLNVFVNHWKSRSGGTDETEFKRILYASALRKVVDSLFSKDASPKIIIMGDFNDEPNNKSVSEALKAYPPDKFIGEKTLYNLFYPAFLNNQGSHYYSGSEWSMLDQIIVSGDLLFSDKKTLHFKNGSAEIFKRNWMLYRNKKGEMLPSRTYKNSEYFGGCSDHLPVIIRLKYAD